MKMIITRAVKEVTPPPNLEPRAGFKGFTLAEVLITLAIIGIVAAMTIPTLMQKYRNKMLEIQFKVAYSMVTQASHKLYVENQWDFINFLGISTEGGDLEPYKNRYLELLPQYYRITEYVDKKNLKDIKMYNSRGNEFSYKEKVLCYYKPVILNNGILMVSTVSTGGLIHIHIDTNGLNKGPNRWGYDLFEFLITTNGKVTGNSENACDFSPGSSSASTGKGCSSYAIQNISPEDKDKKYWDNLP